MYLSRSPSRTAATIYIKTLLNLELGRRFALRVCARRRGHFQSPIPTLQIPSKALDRPRLRDPSWRSQSSYTIGASPARLMNG